MSRISLFIQVYQSVSQLCQLSEYEKRRLYFYQDNSSRSYLNTATIYVCETADYDMKKKNLFFKMII